MIGIDFMLFRLNEISLESARWYHTQGWAVEIFPRHILFSKG